MVAIVRMGSLIHSTSPGLGQDLYSFQLRGIEYPLLPGISYRPSLKPSGKTLRGSPKYLGNAYLGETRADPD